MPLSDLRNTGFCNLQYLGMVLDDPGRLDSVPANPGATSFRESRREPTNVSQYSGDWDVLPQTSGLFKLCELEQCSGIMPSPLSPGTSYGESDTDDQEVRNAT